MNSLDSVSLQNRSNVTLLSEKSQNSRQRAIIVQLLSQSLGPQICINKKNSAQSKTSF